MSRWHGREKLERRFKALTSARAERMLGAALFEAADMIASEAKLSISRGSVSGKGHVPSAPGEPPNYDTGVLSNNIETTQVEPLVVQVSSNAPYSNALEFGRSNMAARPFLRVARDKKRKEARARFAQQVERIARGAAD
jgi:HK97 gp10 family phage protein